MLRYDTFINIIVTNMFAIISLQNHPFTPTHIKTLTYVFTSKHTHTIIHLKASILAHLHLSAERCHPHQAPATPAPRLHRRRPGLRLHLHRLLQPTSHQITIPIPATLLHHLLIQRTLPTRRHSAAFRFVRSRKVQYQRSQWPPLPPPGS